MHAFLIEKVSYKIDKKRAFRYQLLFPTLAASDTGVSPLAHRTPSDTSAAGSHSLCANAEVDLPAVSFLIQLRKLSFIQLALIFFLPCPATLLPCR